MIHLVYTENTFSMESRILHIDMDAFFASVEQVKNPSLKGKPVIVGGAKEDRRGVVSTASYEARKFGVHSAMPLARAKKLCPHGIYLRGSHGEYSRYSKLIQKILLTVSPLVQMASIDEAYIDISGSIRLFGSEDNVAKYIKDSIIDETQLPCTVGISSCKLVSKVASANGKPDGYVNVLQGAEAAFLAPLLVRELPGAGPKICEKLNKIGILTIGDLAQYPTEKLKRQFGAMAVSLQKAANGIGSSKVSLDREAKSISRETTFSEDVGDWEYLKQMISYLRERVMHSLRNEGLEAKTVVLKVRYGDFTTKTFSKSLSEPTSLDKVVEDVSKELIKKGQESIKKVRLIGIGVSQLVHNQHQLSIFDEAGNEKWERATESIDQLRERFGFDAIRSAKTSRLGKQVKLSTPSLSK
jgi:DNA polymerase-4